MTGKIGMQGWVYLIHFDRPYRHAKHYMGWTQDLDERMKTHRLGYGSKLMRVVVARGIPWRVVRVWRGSRHIERQLKKCGGLSRFCPVCTPGTRKGTHIAPSWQ